MFVHGQITERKADNPKKIYTCDFPNCNRQFVRQDLCTRHQERHTARGSHLQRKEPYMDQMVGEPMVSSPTAGYHDSPNASFRSLADVNTGRMSQPSLPNFASPVGISPTAGRALDSLHSRPPSSTPTGSHMRSPQSYQSPTGSGFASIASLNRSNSEDNFYSNSMYRGYDSNPARSVPTPSFEQSYRNVKAEDVDVKMQPMNSSIPPSQQNTTALNGAQGWGTSSTPLYNTSNPPNYTNNSVQQNYNNNYMSNGVTNGSYMSNQSFPNQGPALPPPSFASGNPSSTRPSHAASSSISNPNTMDGTTKNRGNSGSYDINSNITGAPYPGSAYGSDHHSRSPYAMADDFTAWLFSDPNLNNASPVDFPSGPMSFGAPPLMEDPSAMPGIQYGGDDTPLNAQYVHMLPPEHPMAVNSILDSGQAPTILSEQRWQELYELIESRFNETDHAPVRKQKESLLRGDRNEEGHVLSLRMMKTYIGSYWFHFHPQMPILHKPTFSADKTQNLLLVAVITIGAACLDKVHGLKVTQQGAELSNFLAWHLRGEIFKEKDFTPPAKLWVFQALLLLEVYEKMYSTRILHERAHVFHGTTLTLIRRGSSLIGRSPLDSPPMAREETLGINGHGDQQDSSSTTPDQWWNHWVTNEATRRTAFAAFIIDSLHATMFGHGITMVAHEMKLQLPCDESLWSATSAGDVSRIEANLNASGVKPITFFDGLKSTLMGKPVRTNSFGRTALMAGLLNVTWHMNQRDVQVRTLGASQALGGRARWRGALTRAFDFWKEDFERSGGKGTGSTSAFYQLSGRLDEENIFESKTVLHHLAHMAMHVDVVSCQIFANAKRLLGRTTLPSDFTKAQARIKEHWAPKASARDATFYSLKFLQKVLLPDPTGNQPGSSDFGEYSGYFARDDFLLNRPWVLYFATLIVWSYGYALDGPIQSPPDMSTAEQRVYDMRRFLTTVGGIDKPDDLANLRDRNACMGMLYVLKDMFEHCRWELLHEAAILLTNCIEMLKGNT